MKLITFLALILAIGFAASSATVDDFAELNDHHRKYIDRLRLLLKEFIDKLEIYSKNLISALEKVPNMSEDISYLKIVVEKFKTLKFEHFEEVKDCNDLVVVRYSRMRGEMKNELSYSLDPTRNFGFYFNKIGSVVNNEITFFPIVNFRLMDVHDEIEAKYRKDKKTVDDKVKNFADVLNPDEV